MLNLLSKAKPWVVASMLAATSLFGQNAPKKGAMQNQNTMTQDQMMMSGYNAPSRIDVCGSWDVYATGSFIYWQPSEDNIELGASTNNGSLTLPYAGTIVNMDYGFKPGFKVGLGLDVDRDNWTVFSQYTWLQSNDSQSIETTSNTIATNYWTHPLRSTTLLNSVNGKWHVSFDLVDLVLQRSYYVGNQLTFTPYFGGRAAWINQKYTTTSHETIANIDYQTKQKVSSWGVGARTGLDADWLLGYGIRFYGKTALDVIYTQYSKHFVMSNPSTPSTMNDVNLHEYGVGALRPHSELELGFGWGSYFDNNNWHIDLSAGYDFQVFWEQNMFVTFVDTTDVGRVSPLGGNLYLQGLTVDMRLDF